MAGIQQRRGGQFIDDLGRPFWIHGPENNRDLREPRQWRPGRSFAEVLEWKQCSLSGSVSQRFPSPTPACEAFEHAQVVWSQHGDLPCMGEALARHRSGADGKPSAMLFAAARGARPRQPPWSLPVPSGPACAPLPGAAAPSGAELEERPHLPRRRRGASPFAR